LGKTWLGEHMKPNHSKEVEEDAEES